eukprot:10277969-Alexandrium_andersonii.AAC.1
MLQAHTLRTVVLAWRSEALAAHTVLSRPTGLEACSVGGQAHPSPARHASRLREDKARFLASSSVT